MIADPLRHSFNIAGDVAALDRQRAAVPCHRANRVFGYFLNPERRHVPNILTNPLTLAYPPFAKTELTTAKMTHPSRP